MIARPLSLRFLTMLLLCLSATVAWAQEDNEGQSSGTQGDGNQDDKISEEYAAFLKLLRKKDTTAQRLFLKQWEGIGQQDPEFYVSYANYYMNMAKKEVISMKTLPPRNGEESFAITDSAGNTAGYLRSSIVMDSALSEQSLLWLNKGIARFPRRLDLLFGKVHLFGRLEQYDSFTMTLLYAIQKSVEYEFSWQWSRGEEFQDGKEFLFSTCQDYIGQLFNAEDTTAVAWIEPISLALLEIDPKNVPCTANLAVSKMMLQQWQEALIHLEKAHALDRSDNIVLANMGYCHLQLRHKSEAKKYYSLLKKSEEPQYQELAKEMLQLVKQIK